MLQACERMLANGLPARLRAPLIEALTDYRRSWYRSEHPPQPPDWKAASVEARAALRKVCNLALANVRLTASQTAAVKARLAELEH